MTGTLATKWLQRRRSDPSLEDGTVNIDLEVMVGNGMARATDNRMYGARHRHRSLLSVDCQPRCFSLHLFPPLMISCMRDRATRPPEVGTQSCFAFQVRKSVVDKMFAESGAYLHSRVLSRRFSRVDCKANAVELQLVASPDRGPCSEMHEHCCQAVELPCREGLALRASQRCNQERGRVVKCTISRWLAGRQILAMHPS